jgi:hypothetical protein
MKDENLSTRVIPLLTYKKIIEDHVPQFIRDIPNYITLDPHCNQIIIEDGILIQKDEDGPSLKIWHIENDANIRPTSPIGQLALAIINLPYPMDYEQ